MLMAYIRGIKTCLDNMLQFSYLVNTYQYTKNSKMFLWAFLYRIKYKKYTVIFFHLNYVFLIVTAIAAKRQNFMLNDMIHIEVSQLLFSFSHVHYCVLILNLVYHLVSQFRV